MQKGTVFHKELPADTVFYVSIMKYFVADTGEYYTRFVIEADVLETRLSMFKLKRLSHVSRKNVTSTRFDDDIVTFKTHAEATQWIRNFRKFHANTVVNK